MYIVKGTPINVACLRERVFNYEVSVSFDDSCGTLRNLLRADIRVYRTTTDEDITAEVFGRTGTVPADFDNFMYAVMWCRNH